MAKQAWEKFNADCPRPVGNWMAYDWEARRGRRLAALDRRATELKQIREGATDEVRVRCEAEVVRRVEALEHRCSELLVEWSMQERGLESGELAPQPVPEPPAPTRRPRLRR